MMKIDIVCPLGADCEKAVDGKVLRCAWYTKLAGTTPDGKEIEEYRCAMAWLPIIMLENAQTNRGQTSAIESLRNIVAQGRPQIAQQSSDRGRLPSDG